ncbi:VOC family protein [Rhodococcus sp. G-MC3]|uniref:VOC family protein n=1 Tax=Rhodococcus sp. G-MC3 TaxID=3046209 RepID=UPI0024BBD921|nr:VOC family protein [Rhodococcus sp. G-MC3]MDJ0396399.1 VOC family protein [Rhodococcus sp. G-MC3]
MALHTLSRVTIGVPNVAETAAFYDDFGLTRTAGTRSGRTDSVTFATVDGGEQLELVPVPGRRRLIGIDVGVDDTDDLDRIAHNLHTLGLMSTRTDTDLSVTDPGTDVLVRVVVTSRIVQTPFVVPAYNSPGNIARDATRADGIERTGRVRPRKLGHVVIGSTDQPASERFFTEGLGFKVSDRIPGLAAFMRCSTDHHNVLVQAAPVTMLHHSSWQVDDVDEIGRGATAMLEKDPDRHIWGLGRHHVGSNFFWYLKDPAGNFSEYYSDLDCIVDDQLWTPRDWEGARALFNWGPPPPPSFLAPEDLAGLMAGTHG